MIKPITSLAMLVCLAACSPGEQKAPAENVFSGQTQALDKAKESAAAIEQAQDAQQQQIQQQSGQ